MKILAFDTTNINSSVALFDDGNVDLSVIDDELKPAESLLEMIEDILARGEISYDDLDAIAVSSGPGSFTTVRIGLSVAKTLALVAKNVMLSFDSLEALARKYRDFNGRIFVAMDAKMDEFFVAEFLCCNGELQCVFPSKLIEFDELGKFDFSGDLLICGSAKNIVGKVAFDKGFVVKICDNNDGFSADGLALLAHEKLLNNEVNSDLDANYLRLPKISKRK